MSFTTPAFLIFFIIIFAAYWLVRRRAWQNMLLLAASYVFYAWVHPWYAILLGVATLADYVLARGMVVRRERARTLLWVSLVLNLGVLAFFKYYDFFHVALAGRLAAMGIHADPLLLGIALPAGLSFYTIKKLIYVLDVSRGTLRPTHNLIDFALYVSFFPQSIAGPIDRPQKLLPQIETERSWKAANFHTAWPMLVMGLFKKIVVADTVKSIVDRIFTVEQSSWLLVLVAASGFTLVILADFSAYTDISRAVALLLGFETSENFNDPYLALTPSEFWNRWHITLSNFLRDYIFFPLRRSIMRHKNWPAWLPQLVPPLVTMFISGLWHGAGWTFVLWGLYHGLLLVIYQALGIRGDWKPVHPLKRFAAWVPMFVLTVFGWLLFRAPSAAWLWNLFGHTQLIGDRNYVLTALLSAGIIAFYAVPLFIKMALDRFAKPESWWRALYYAGLIVMIILYTNSSNPDFIYLQF
jgi:D-alanyl-lipoteichoic acid acyltransferase DltB (MBOAT superfamily)